MRALVIALLLIASLAAPVASVAAGKTKVVVFRPWASTGLAAGFKVVHTVSGSCWEHALSTSRPDAWRCTAGNEIMDPCFSGAPHGSEVACADDPFARRVSVMKLTKRLSDEKNPIVDWLQPKGEPWAVRLVSGDTCYFSTGATDVVGGERMNYECSGDGWLVGSANRSSATWRIGRIVWPDKKHVKSVGIAIAVF